MLIYFYVSEESMKEETARKAKTELHDAVNQMRMKAVIAEAKGEPVSQEQLIEILSEVHPYKHSYTLMTDSTGRFVFMSDSTLLDKGMSSVNELRSTMLKGKSGMQEVLKGSDI
jgi:hypothetical protein